MDQKLRQADYAFLENIKGFPAQLPQNRIHYQYFKSQNYPKYRFMKSLVLERVLQIKV